MGKIYNSSCSSGKANFGWLIANDSFNFTNYISHSSLGSPGVLNEAVFGSGKGLGIQPQEKMIMITLPLEGSLK